MKDEWEYLNFSEIIKSPSLVFCVGEGENERKAYLAICDVDSNVEAIGTLESTPVTVYDYSKVIADMALLLQRELA